MTKYRVPIKIEFDGVAWIDAKDEEEAEKIAVMQIRGDDAGVYTHGHPAIIEWVINPHGYTTRRDDESIEEVEEI